MPGNRDDFPFSLAEWSLPSYFAPFCTFPAMFSLMRENLSSHGWTIHHLANSANEFLWMLTPPAWNSSSLKDGYVTLSRFTFLLKLIIKRTFSLLFYARFLFFLTSPLDTCVIIWQMYHPSQTSSPAVSRTWIAPTWGLGINSRKWTLWFSCTPSNTVKRGHQSSDVSPAQQSGSHSLYNSHVFLQGQTRVKLNRVLFLADSAKSVPFAAVSFDGTYGISFIHSSASLIRWQGIWLPLEGHSYSRHLPVLGWISRALGINHITSTPFPAIATLCFN